MDIMDEITEFINIGFDFTNQQTLNIIDDLFSEFEGIQGEITQMLLENQNINLQLNQLKNITFNINETWSLITEKVKKKRQCVGNLIDVTSNPLFITRPIFYCIISLFFGTLMLYYSFKRMRPQTVLKIINNPSPLL